MWQLSPRLAWLSTPRMWPLRHLWPASMLPISMPTWSLLEDIVGWGPIIYPVGIVRSYSNCFTHDSSLTIVIITRHFEDCHLIWWDCLAECKFTSILAFWRKIDASLRRNCCFCFWVDPLLYLIWTAVSSQHVLQFSVQVSSTRLHKDFLVRCSNIITSHKVYCTINLMGKIKRQRVQST